jgi:exodeoxyribonuclease VII small subunit
MIVHCCKRPPLVQYDKIGTDMSNPNPAFEEALERLEKIVAQMESGDLKLEDSLKLFEEGMKLTRICHQRLDDVEKKVKQLLKSTPKPDSPEGGKPPKH